MQWRRVLRRILNSSSGFQQTRKLASYCAPLIIYYYLVSVYLDARGWYNNIAICIIFVYTPGIPDVSQEIAPSTYSMHTTGESVSNLISDLLEMHCAPSGRQFSEKRTTATAQSLQFYRTSNNRFYQVGWGACCRIEWSARHNIIISLYSYLY